MNQTWSGEMRFLIAGFGSIGRRHFHNLAALNQTDIIFYRSTKSQLPVEELRDFVVETDFLVALSHRPDAVIIANPTALHLEVAIPAAQAGCHLLIEKPISHTLENLDALNTAVKKSGCRVLAGFQFRFHPGLQRAKDLLLSRELGRPLLAHAHWGEYLPDWHPWEDYRQSYSARSDLGGGVVLTLNHPFDYLRWLLGEVDTVSGHIRNSGKLELDVEDEADIDLEISDGIHANVHLDYLQKPATHWLEIVCSKGKIFWDGISGLLRVFGATGDIKQEIPVPVGFERNDLFLAEINHFIKVVKGDAESVCTLDDGIKALQIALAVQTSSVEGRKINL
jgi:predicted dehydrogenase